MSSTPPLRADAARNRERLLAAATRALSSADGEPSMRAIAREAGVGTGTLYRHFPTREALVDAVYRDEVSRLTDGARELLAALAPAEAMRLWMDLFGGWLTSRSGMLAALPAWIGDGAPTHAESRDELLSGIELILAAGRARGDLRADVDAADVAAALIGLFTVAGDDRLRARRLLDLLMDGLRPPR
jgi:AcrR family transcriptional regulator